MGGLVETYEIECRCVNCGDSWPDGPGQLGLQYGPGCPSCGGLYWTAHRYKPRQLIAVETPLG